jgi:hypothetical protein
VFTEVPGGWAICERPLALRARLAAGVPFSYRDPAPRESGLGATLHRPGGRRALALGAESLCAVPLRGLRADSGLVENPI